jgi:hypothetical protein
LSFHQTGDDLMAFNGDSVIKKVIALKGFLASLPPLWIIKKSLNLGQNNQIFLLSIISYWL